ncbi:MAG: hypothetical protein JJT88_03405 [Gammaproteobacteria bacterium]|nr:hypothetical protein [Gammaproteobacteria bacterium]
MNWIIGLDDAQAQDPRHCGGKGANLARLRAAGLPVPPGFVVSAAAHARFLSAVTDPGGLPVAVGADQLEAFCVERRSRLLSTALPADLAREIADAWRVLSAGRGEDFRCAVRSSATAEDGADASFAGQHDTYYFVDGSTLADHIRACWASLWTVQALQYRTTHGVADETVAMAVVVQELIAADVSGVAFTANPVTTTDDLVVEATWGLGAALLDGRVSPDRYRVARSDFAVLERHLGSKQLAVAADGTLQPVSDEERERETLLPQALAEVCAMALRCEEAFGGPQDVEWALAGERLWVLQSRPVTTLASPPAPVTPALPTGIFVLAKPLVENFSGPISPLLADLLECAVGPRLKVIYGRIYADISGYRPLMPWVMTDAEIARYLYSMFAILPERRRLSIPGLLRLTAAVLLAVLLLGPLLARSRNMPDDFMDGFAEHSRRLADDPDIDPLTLLTTLAMQPRLTSPLGLQPIAVNITAIRGAFWMGCVRLMLQRWTPDLPPELAVHLSHGRQGVRTAEMGQAIEGLAALARTTAAVAAILHGATTAEATLARLRAEPEAASFLAGLEGFLVVHGHRALRELDPCVARWREDPLPVLMMIRNQMAMSTDAGSRLERGFEARQAAATQVRAGLLAAAPRRAAWRWRLIDFAAARVGYFFKLRENSRFAHIHIFDALRRRLRVIGSDLLQRGLLRKWDDIFLLRLPELDAIAAGEMAAPAIQDRLADRRREQRQWARMTAPMTIGVEIDLEPDRYAADAGTLLRGLSASPGQCRGRARVIIDPTVDATLLPGEILVAPFTDPAWTPLFLTAGAAVVEVGSFLSHAGTVAREYGMPCVVDVERCTERIGTGDLIEVDGSAGTVRLLSGEAPA